jgi:peptidoglycan/xylan/chitin deacetylase (PgdA/CDA1 family)
MKPLSRVEAILVRGAGTLLAPGGGRGSLLILIYHRVLPTPDPLLPDEPDAKTFAAQVDVISSTCQVLPLAEAVERLYSGSLPARAACITFDDGYENNVTVAAPILAARKVPATVFVATGFTGAGRMWNDTVIESVRCAKGDELNLSALGLERYSIVDWTARRQALSAILGKVKYLPIDERLEKAAAIAEVAGLDAATKLMMNEAQIREIRGFGFDVGAHTVMHPILTRVDPERARSEIESSKATLESIIGAKVTTFAYPNGRPNQDYDASHVEIVKRAGFSCAVSTAWGAAGRTANRFQLPRMLPWDRSPLKFAARLFSTYREQRAAVA